ncbi:MAG: hypothetical protein ABIE07_00890 [Candidatus Zixiibacteriota bacterium]
MNDIDEVDMIRDNDIKGYFNSAIQEFENENYKKALEYIGIALFYSFKNNKGLRDLPVGSTDVTQALKVSAFGIKPHEFLTLQEFLPSIYKPYDSDKIKLEWKRKPYGHPANWRLDAVEFCLQISLQTILRTQNWEWIPGAIEFIYVYEEMITAMVDNVQIIQDTSDKITEHSNEKTVHVLQKGESLRGIVSKIEKEQPGPNLLELLAPNNNQKVDHSNCLMIYSPYDKISGRVEKDKVEVSVVPRDIEWVQESFPDLPILKWENE